MILRVYGETVQSVEMHFDSKAFNEIGFRRDRRQSFPLADFEAGWEKVSEHEITAKAEGVVQDHTQQTLLDSMAGDVRQLLDGLGDDEAVRIENDETDWPKARDTQRKIVEDGRNRLHFEAWVEPPLRVAIWRKRPD